MKRTSQHVVKQSFYRLTKTSVTHNTKDHPNLQFMRNCYEREVIPDPIFAKIEQGTLNLTGYHISQGQALALEIYLRENMKNVENLKQKVPIDSSIIHTLILHSNGCSDKSLASILQGLMEQQKLRHFHYSGNTLGKESVE